MITVKFIKIFAKRDALIVSKSWDHYMRSKSFLKTRSGLTFTQFDGGRIRKGWIFQGGLKLTKLRFEIENKKENES